MAIPSASNGTTENVGVRPKVLPSKTPQNLEHASTIDIIDIRHDAVEINLKDEIMSSLRPHSGPKSLPTLLLYDERGLQLFEEVSPTNQMPRNESTY
jgi:L-histidine Nalpha-methyltransferase / hercynylcysteine S-oxide synthase